jgi:hypothetical protein
MPSILVFMIMYVLERTTPLEGITVLVIVDMVRFYPRQGMWVNMPGMAACANSGIALCERF